MNILITTPTGTIGGRVLALAGAEHTLLAAGRRVGPQAADLLLDFARPETYAAIDQHFDSVLLVRPPQLADVDTYFQPFIDWCLTHTQKLVYLSILDAPNKQLTPHFKIERAIQASGIRYVFVRSGYFIQNLLISHGLEIRRFGTLSLPSGDGKFAYVDAADIAAVAYRALTDATLENVAFEITGPEALHPSEAVTRLGRLLQRPLAFRPVGPLGFIRRRRALGDPWTKIFVMLYLYRDAKKGGAARITSDFEQLMGRSPRTIQTFLETSYTAFLPSS